MSNVRVILDEEVDELIEVLLIAGDQFATIGDRDTAGRCRRLAREIRDQRDGQIEISLRSWDQDRPDPIETSLDDEKIIPLTLRADAIPPIPDTRIQIAPPAVNRPIPAVSSSTPPVDTGGWPRNADGITRMMVPAGIGDIAWLWQKIAGLETRWGNPVELVIAGDRPRRAQEFVELLPGVRFGGYGDFGSQDVGESLRARPLPTTVDEIKGMTLPASVNHHLEIGGRIEAVWPEIETRFDLQLRTTDDHRTRASTILDRTTARKRGRPPTNPPKPLPVVGLYTSSKTQGGGLWDAHGWALVAAGLSRECHCTFVVIGAEFDRDLVDPVVEKLQALQIPTRTVVGESFGVVAEVIKGLDLLIAYPSGIPIVAILMGIPTVWWLPDHPIPHGGNWSNLTGFIPLESLESGIVETRRFEDPQSAIAGVLASRPFARIKMDTVSLVRA